MYCNFCGNFAGSVDSSDSACVVVTDFVLLITLILEP